MVAEPLSHPLCGRFAHTLYQIKPQIILVPLGRLLISSSAPSRDLSTAQTQLPTHQTVGKTSICDVWLLHQSSIPGPLPAPLPLCSVQRVGVLKATDELALVSASFETGLLAAIISMFACHTQTLACNISPCFFQGRLHGARRTVSFTSTLLLSFLRPVRPTPANMIDLRFLWDCANIGWSDSRGHFRDKEPEKQLGTASSYQGQHLSITLSTQRTSVPLSTHSSPHLLLRIQKPCLSPELTRKR